MELRQLEYFVAVAEEANFTRAAERVHISQSGVSAQIRQLERAIGAPLFDRSGRVASLTPAGTAALPHARQALAAADAVRRSVDEVNELVRGRVALAMVTACTVKPLFDALAAFHVDHPGVEIELSEGTSDRMVGQVRSGDVDLALVGCAGAPPEDLESLTIVSEGLSAVVPAAHPLAAASDVALEALVEHRLVCLPPGTGIRTVFDLACAAHGLRATVTIEANAPEAVLDLAARGLGVAVLSRSMTAEIGTHLASVPLTGIDVPAVLALVWKDGPNPAVRAVVAQCERAFAPVSV